MCHVNVLYLPKLSHHKETNPYVCMYNVYSCSQSILSFHKLMSICTKRTKKPLSYRGQVNIILLRRYIVCTELANLNRRVKCIRSRYMTPSSLSYPEMCALCTNAVVVTVHI